MVLLAAIAPAPARAVEPMCTPAVDASSKPIDADLELTKITNGGGTCTRPIRIANRGPDGALWGVDWNPELWRSSDDGTSWQLVATIPGYSNVEQVLPLASGYVLVEAADATRRRHILRSTTPSATQFVPVLTLPADTWLPFNQSWLESDGKVYAAAYGADSGTVRSLFRSTDDGRSFAPVYSTADVRHFHTVEADPYVPHRIWVTAGDGATQARIGYSDDSGQSFRWIGPGKYPANRAVGLMFTRDAVYWGADVPEMLVGLYRYDRATGAVTTVLTDLQGSFRLSVPAGDVIATFTAVESPFIGDQFVHVLTSNGGLTWTSAITPLEHSASDPYTAVPMAVTAPDASGRVWLSVTHLKQSPSGISNVEFRLIDRTPPRTRIDSGPGPGSSSRAEFSFSSDDAASTFECRLDAGPWTACASPITYFSVADGAHVFSVRARDRAGNVDPVPPTYNWKATHAPIAVASPTQTRALTGETIRFDASASLAAEGRTIVDYAWDLDRNGVYETDTGPDPAISTSWGTPGPHAVGIRVRDDRGMAAQAISGAVAISPAPPGGEVGVTINHGAQFTNTRTVTLSIVWPPFADLALISNDGGFGSPTTLPLTKDVPWVLPTDPGSRSPVEVYVRFRGAGVSDTTMHDDIVLDQRSPSVTAATLLRASGPSHPHVATLVVTASDAGSGVRDEQVASRRSASRAWKRFARRRDVSRVHRPHWVRVRDRAGNVSSWHRIRVRRRHSARRTRAS